MKRSALDRLLDLRRRREERSLEALTVREGAHRRAKNQADEAQEAVLRHAAEAKEHERQLMASLLGQNINQAALARVQANLDVVAIEHQDLRGHEEVAKKDLKDRRQELDKARKTYRDRHKDAEKLGEFVQRQAAKTARRQIAIDETIEEDQGSLAPRRAQLL